VVTKMCEPLEPTVEELINLCSEDARGYLTTFLNGTANVKDYLDLTLDKYNKKEEKNPFSLEAVERFKKNNPIEAPLRHYTQLVIEFNPVEFQKIFLKLGIPTNNICVTVIGGYTGQFASLLNSLGMKVIFTDPLKEWVDKAASEGLEAYEYSLQSLSSDVVRRTNLFATFECYNAFEWGNSGESEIYDRLRILTAEHGFIFVDSLKTLQDIKEDVQWGVVSKKLKSVKSIFVKITKAYHIKRKATWSEDKKLRFTHIQATPEQRKSIMIDCRVMRTLYYLAFMREIRDLTSSADELLLEKDTTSFICRHLDLGYVEYLKSLYRILVMTEPIAWERRKNFTFDPQVFCIHGKRFRLGENVIQDLEKELRVFFRKNPSNRRFVCTLESL